MKQLVTLAAVVLTATIAHAGTWFTYNQPNGNSMTLGPNGQTYFQYRQPNGGSMTLGPDGQTWFTYRTPGGSMTLGPTGNPYHQPSFGSGWGDDDDE